MKEIDLHEFLKGIFDGTHYLQRNLLPTLQFVLGTPKYIFFYHIILGLFYISIHKNNSKILNVFKSSLIFWIFKDTTKHLRLMTSKYEFLPYF